MEILIEKGYDAVCEAAFRVVASELKRKPALVLGLATGKTPLGLYERLARSGLSLRRARFFNLDELYGLGPESPRSFHALLCRQLLAPLRVPARNIRLLRGDAKDPEKAALAYERSIRAAGGIDLQLLGIGRNGHIGFNEPGSSLGSRTRAKTLDENTLADYAGAFPPGAKVPRFSITMGVGTILEARRLLLLASGKSKAEVIRRAVEGPVSAETPGSALQFHPRATAILDEAAASRLKRRGYWRWVQLNKWRVGQ